MSIEKIRTAFHTILASRPLSTVLPTSLVRELGVESGIPQAFDWLHSNIQLSRQRTQKRDEIIPQIPILPSHLRPVLNVWFSRLKDDVAPEELLPQFANGALPSWDHYFKIRVIFHILQKHGRQQGV